MGNVEYTKHHFEVIACLYENECTNAMKSYTRKMIAEDKKLSMPTVIKATEIFLKLGYIDEGAMIRKAKTYFITVNGLTAIKELM